MPIKAQSQERESAIQAGILPAAALRDAAASGAILGDIADDQLQPASLDLRLGATAYRLRASFLPSSVSIGEKIKQVSTHKLDLRSSTQQGGAVLEKGCVYLVELKEALALPPEISGIANPKSSTGRIDVFTRVITEQGRSFDKIEAGYSGALYLEISPRSFSILVREGSRLAQLRLRRNCIGENIRDDATILKQLHQVSPLIENVADIGEHIDNGGLALSVDLTPNNKAEKNAPIGYRAKAHSGLIDVDKPNALQVSDFWEPIYAAASPFLILDPDAFYILASREAVCIPPNYAAEMLPFDPMVGEFRVHYAGFFDPGFGFESATNARGARAVLEVRSRDVPFILEHGQTIGRLLFEPLTQATPLLYGAELNSHYQSQGLRLSKHFILHENLNKNLHENRDE